MSVVIFVGSIALIAGFALSYLKIGPFADADKANPNAQGEEGKPRMFASFNPREPDQMAIHYWDMPKEVVDASIKAGDVSNILSVDYVGSEACQSCHAEIHDSWSKSYHNSTNLAPNVDSVKGDFSGESSIDYLGGKATFYQENDEYRMKLLRDGLERIYRVTGTVGGRYFQAYSGRLIEGPEPEDHFVRHKDIQLPFNYQIDRGQWVPPTHPGGVAAPAEKDPDPFGADGHVVNFDQQCVICHTTRPLGDWLVADSGKTRVVFHAGRPLGFWLGAYIANVHPEYLPADKPIHLVPDERVEFILKEMDNISIEHGSVSRGVSCEACHLGTRQHANLSTPETNGQPTRYFPSSRFLVIPKPEGTEAEAEEEVWGRSANNLNFMCARCHTDERPRYANGMSISYGASLSDADRGHCYHAAEVGSGPQSQLTCVTCHDPHKSAEREWNQTPEQEDARCVKCHNEFESADAVKAHAHHEVGTAGSHCMDCHMPKMIEGRQGVVRTHMIFSPTDVSMLEANQPNACNLCHLDEPIDWTIDHLKEWYPSKPNDEVAKEVKPGAKVPPKSVESISEEKLASNYPNRKGKAGLGWLNNPHAPTRLVAIEALSKANARWALADLVEALDDKSMSNRMFAQENLEKMLGLSLGKFGYRYYMTPTERREALDRIRAEVVKPSGDSATTPAAE